jgi:hypothetical protein
MSVRKIKAGIIIIILILLVIFLVQNSDPRPLTFLAWDWNISGSIQIMVTAILGLILGFIGGRLSEDSNPKPVTSHGPDPLLRANQPQEKQE